MSGTELPDIGKLKDMMEYLQNLKLPDLDQFPGLKETLANAETTKFTKKQKRQLELGESMNFATKHLQSELPAEEDSLRRLEALKREVEAMEGPDLDKIDINKVKKLFLENLPSDETRSLMEALSGSFAGSKKPAKDPLGIGNLRPDKKTIRALNSMKIVKRKAIPKVEKPIVPRYSNYTKQPMQFWTEPLNRRKYFEFLGTSLANNPALFPPTESNKQVTIEQALYKMTNDSMLQSGGTKGHLSGVSNLDRSSITRWPYSCHVYGRLIH